MKLARIAVIALLGIVLVSTVACGSTSSSNPTITPASTPNLITIASVYTDNANGFSIPLMNGWDIDEMEGVEDGATFRDYSGCGKSYPYYGVIKSSAEGYTSVQTYYSENIEPYIEGYDGYYLVSKVNPPIDGVPAIGVVYTYVQEGADIVEMGCYFIRDDTLWGFAAGCSDTCWEEYVHIFDFVLSEFEILD
jgi:hypothetical protein